MANLLTNILSGVGSVAKGVGSAAGDIGKGLVSGAGEAAGVGQIFKPSVSTMITKSPKTGILGQVSVPATPSVWNKVGSSLGARAVGSPAPPSSGSSISPPSYGTSVTQGKPYQGKRKDENYDTLLQRLEELARR